MQITYTKPADRGVTTLMYVGDDDAVDKATSRPSPAELLVAAIAALYAAKARGAARVAAGAVVAYTGYRLVR